MSKRELKNNRNDFEKLNAELEKICTCYVGRDYLLSVNKCRQLIKGFVKESDSIKHKEYSNMARYLSSLCNHFADGYLELYIQNKALPDSIEDFSELLTEQMDSLRRVGALYQLFACGQSDEKFFDNLMKANSINARFQFLLREINGLHVDSGQPVSPDEIGELLPSDDSFSDIPQEAVEVAAYSAACMSQELMNFVEGINDLIVMLDTCTMEEELEDGRLKLREIMVERSNRYKKSAELYSSLASKLENALKSDKGEERV